MLNFQKFNRFMFWLGVVLTFASMAEVFAQEAANTVIPTTSNVTPISTTATTLDVTETIKLFEGISTKSDRFLMVTILGILLIFAAVVFRMLINQQEKQRDANTALQKEFTDHLKTSNSDMVARLQANTDAQNRNTDQLAELAKSINKLSPD